MPGRCIGVLHPGEMGSVVALTLLSGGNEVFWASEDRGSETQARASALGLQDAGTAAELCARCEILFSVCPPEFADDVADHVLLAGFQGLYVDANAISP